jgi:O-antigen ligase
MKIKINLKFISIYFLILLSCFKWFFNGVLGNYWLQCIVLMFGLFLSLVKKRFKIFNINFIWFFFPLGIGLSLIYGKYSNGILMQYILMFIIVCYVIFYKNEPSYYWKPIRVLFAFGFVYGILIIVQYFFSDSFNIILFSSLKPISRDFAEKYFNDGYYYGVFFTPADPAGLLIFTISGILFYRIIKPKKNKIYYFYILFLVFPLLLTGKKGVLLCGGLAFVFTMLIFYGNKKQWGRVICFLFTIIVAYFLFHYLATMNPDNPLFHRFNQFFEALSEGGEVDSGRSTLYYIALQLWKQNWLTGIGWRQFNGLTTSVYGYIRGHEVNCDYIQFLCETGIIGTILVFIPIVFTFIKAIKLCKRICTISKIDIITRYIVIFATYIQIFILIYAFVEIPFYDTFFFIIYIFSCIIVKDTYAKYFNSSISLEVQ